MNRRAVFFICAAIVCAVLVPLTVPAIRYVPKILALIYVALAAASYADARANR